MYTFVTYIFQMDILEQIKIEETLALLDEWNVDVDDEMTQPVFLMVVSVVRQVRANKHTKATDFFIEKCNAAFEFEYDMYYMDEDTILSLNMVYNLLKATFFAFDLTLKDLSAYKIQRKKVPLFVSLGNEVMELRRQKNYALKDKLKNDILEELDVDVLVGLEKQKQMFYEFLCGVYFSEIQTHFFLNYLKANCLDKFLDDVKYFGDIKKGWFLQLSDIIIDKYMYIGNLAHKDLLKELTNQLHATRKAVVKKVETYADTLFKNGSIQDCFDSYELNLFFGNDLSLDKTKRQFDGLMKSRMLKRHAVSEYIFDQMKACSNHTNCKFNCKYDVCRYKTLLELLASHLPQYNVIRIDEKVGEDIQTDFLFVIDEKEEILMLVLCSSLPYPPSSIYLFEVQKKHYTDALFILQRYFESDYECKRKNLMTALQRFGRNFGIVFTKVYRK